MQQIPDTNVPQKNRRVFWIVYNTTLFLLLGAIVFAVIQKGHEGAVAITAAKSLAETGAISYDTLQHIQAAGHWMKVSWATIALAVLSWGIALWYHEKQRWVWGLLVVLFAFFVLLQLLIV